jgi:Rrf2 family protein
MRVSAKADYAVRATITLAAGASESAPMKGEAIASAEKIPLPFLQNIFAELRHHGLVSSRRGADGGHWLTRPADDITIAEVIRAVDGPLASVRGESPKDLSYTAEALPLQSVWLALRANVRQVLESVTLADVVSKELPEPVLGLSEHPDATSER